MRTGQEHSQFETISLGELVSSPQQTSSLEASQNLEDNDQIDNTVLIDGSTGQMGPSHGPAGHSSESLAHPDLPQTTTDPMTALRGDDVRANIKKDLHAGRFEIPPFDASMVPERSLVTYQFPPALLDHDCVSKYKKRFDRSALLPDSNLPLCSQIMAYGQSWGMWVAEHPDKEIRDNLLDRVFKMCKDAWSEALQLGYRPDGAGTEGAGARTSNKRGKSKRAISPSRVPFLTASHKYGRDWAITAGELAAHGISEARIRTRAANQSSLDNAGRKLLRSILNTYDNEISMTDWSGTEEKTKLNPMGRDLAVYCLFEVLKSDVSLRMLEGYYEKQSRPKQKEATQTRIDDEQDRQNLFLALAMELEEDNPRAPSPAISILSDTQSESATSTAVSSTAEADEIQQLQALVEATESTVETDQVEQLETLIDAVQRIRGETDISYLISTFELYEISEGDIVTGVSIEDLSSSSERCKYVMREMLSYARQWEASSNKRKAEVQIGQGKTILANLLPSLFAERDAAKGFVSEDDTTADIDMVPNSPVMLPAELQDLTKRTSDLAPVVPAQRLLSIQEDLALEAQSLSIKRQKTGDNRSSEQIKALVPSAEGLREASERKAEQHLIAGEEATITISNTKSNAPQHGSSITLHLRSGYDPDQWTSKKLFRMLGFSYRYALESTLAQRLAMTDTLISYVRGCNQQRDSDWRFGRYQSLAHPDHPNVTIIHGVWDLKNGRRPAKFERFYRGDRDYTDELEATLMSDTENEDDEPITPPKTPFSVTLKRQAPEDNISLPQPKKQQIAKPEGKSVRSTRQESAQDTTIEAKKIRVRRPRGQKNNHLGTSKITAYGTMTKPRSGAPRLTLDPHKAATTAASNDTMSMTRSRRRTAPKSYAEQTDDANDDEDFEPSD